MADPPAPAEPAATILLLRDAPAGLQVFMVQRHHRIDFATGALVFPGGKVDPADREPRLAPRCQEAGNLSEADRALRVAAIRETFEEAGVLLARHGGEAELLRGDPLEQMARRHPGASRGVPRAFGKLVEEEDLLLACERLVPFAHWITPTFMPRRFDTWFFLVDAPQHQLARHDGRESVDSRWIRPLDAVEDARAGRCTIIFPTLMNLQKLGRSRSVQEALATARQAPVVTVLPRLEQRGSEQVMVLPAEAGYDVVEAPLSDVR